MAKIADLFVDLHLDTKAFSRELNTALARASSRNVKISVKADTRSASKSVKGLDRDIQKATTGLNKYTGRLAAVGDALLALAPAAVGVGAVAVPAVVALGVGLADAGVAAGTAIIAFKGVGTALTSISKAKLDPSITNLKAMDLALSALSPAARQFTIYLSSLSGELNTLKQSAGKNLFPGLESGMQAASKRLPQVNGLLKEFGGIVGNIADQAGHAFASNRYDPLFHMLKTTGKPILEDTYHAVENVVHGAVALADAFAPLSKGGFDWMKDVTKNFDDWATGLDKTQGFKDFLAYVKTTGPQVASAVEAIAKAFIAIAKAAAPLSGPILKAITALANVIAKIADSPIGPALFGSVLAMRAFGRASQIAAPAISAVSTGILDLRTSPNVAATALGQLKSGVKGLAGPAGLAGLALSASSSNEAVNILGSTASGALLGFSLGGPVGAAVGAGAGALLGFAEAASHAKNAMQQWDDVVKSGTTNVKAFKKVADEAQGALNAQAKIQDSLTQAEKDSIQIAATHDRYAARYMAQQTETNKVNEEAVGHYQDLVAGVNDLGHALNIVPVDKTVTNTGRLNDIVKQAVPTMDALGISWKDFQAATESGTTDKLIQRMKDYVTSTDSAAGKNKALASSFQALDSKILSTADSADQLSTALNSIIAPAIAAGTAADTFQQGLNDIKKNSDTSSRALKGTTDAAIKNRGVFRGLTTDLVNNATAAAQNGASSERVAEIIGRGRQKIIDYGKANNFSAGAIKGMLKQMHLTPGLVKTIFKSIGVDDATRKARNLADQIKGIPRQHIVKLLTDGIPLSIRQMENLKSKLPKAEYKTLIKLDTADAEKKQKAVQSTNATIADHQINPKVTMDTSGFDTGAAHVKSTLSGINGQSATTYIYTQHVDTFTTRKGGTQPGQAGGGLIRGPGSGTSDSVSARLSNGEYVMRAAAVSKYGSGFMGQVNAMRFAAGGAVSKKRREIFGTASLRDFANGLKKGFDASAVYKELHKIIQHDLSGQAERNQLRLLGHMDKTLEKIHEISKKVDQARQRLQNARSARADFQSSFATAVGPNISELGSAPGGIAGGLHAKLHLVRAFVRNLKKLGAKKFLPRALLAQVAQLGPVDGNSAALQLLALSDKQLRAVGGDFRALDTFAKSQSKVLGKAYYNADIASAKAHLKQMQKDQKHYNHIFEVAADAFATQLAHRLNVNLHPHPHKGKGKGTHDAGGWLDVGSSLVSNQTGRPEAVYTQEQWQRMDRLVAALERGGPGVRVGAPLIGHADIHHEVDLERYERQRAFRDRMTRIGG